MQKLLILVCGFLTFSFSAASPLDYTIPMQVKGVDAMKMIHDGNRLADTILQNKIESEKSRIYLDGDSDPEKMIILAKKSKLARFIVPYFQEQLNLHQKHLALKQVDDTQSGVSAKDRESLRKACADLGEIAELAMSTRQRGVSIQSMYKTLETQNEEFRIIVESIINSAFDVGLAKDETEAKKIASEFSNQIFKNCMSY